MARPADLSAKIEIGWVARLQPSYWVISGADFGRASFAHSFCLFALYLTLDS